MVKFSVYKQIFSLNKFGKFVEFLPGDGFKINGIDPLELSLFLIKFVNGNTQLFSPEVDDFIRQTLGECANWTNRRICCF